MKTGRLTAIIEKDLSSSPKINRDYIGASSIGSPCLRQVYYSYHGADGHGVSARTQRIFDMGNILEGLIISFLQDSGIEVTLPDEFNHNLLYFDSDFEYFRGHADGLLPKYKSILEIKTMNHAGFMKFSNSGLKISHPIYYSQVQAYMGMSGLGRAFVVGLDKDKATMHDEEIVYSAEHYEYLRSRAKLVYNAKSEPPRVHGNPSYFICKMCRYNSTCHDK